MRVHANHMGSEGLREVVIADGAESIWNLADLYFPGAVQIVDLFQARQHYWDLTRKLHPNQQAEQRRWMMVHQDMLDEGKIEELVVAIRRDPAAPGFTTESRSCRIRVRKRVDAPWGYCEDAHLRNGVSWLPVMTIQWGNGYAFPGKINPDL